MLGLGYKRFLKWISLPLYSDLVINQFTIVFECGFFPSFLYKKKDTLKKEIKFNAFDLKIKDTL